VKEVSMRKARKAIVLLLAASLAAALGCSDRSPTSPAMGSAVSTEAIAGPTPGPVARPRNAVLVPPRGDKSLPPGVWGNAQASLAIGPNGATLEILSGNFPTGACFGKYGNTIQGIPDGRFSLPGTFTQLIGAYPGKIQYPAGYVGIVLGDTMSLTVTVPALHQDFGPYFLVKGVTHAWTPCLYP
jgi:hypothetical protein